MIMIPGQVTLAQLESIYRENLAPTLDPVCRPGVEAAARRIATAASSDLPT